MVSRIILAIVLTLSLGCTSQNYLVPDIYAGKVEKDFRERNVIPSSHRRELNIFFKNTNDNREPELLRFLYAYMPLSDLADYPVEFFADNARMALKARDEMPWSAKIPDDIFLHYILPVRVNNENLDTFRSVMYGEIKERVEGLGLVEAVLEINRWCHEKVTYQPSDIRTSSPLATVLSSRGRCGEESTFTVAALRTAGIPARQVYTPRWAHSDDNHAWVEVWIDGDWFYLGACEPEPVLDRGWFTEPARRAMLVHTKAFGYYMGNENLIRREKLFSEINNLSKYAETRTVTVQVLNRETPVGDIDVEFCLYNYAEFYPIARVKADRNGFASLETGLGDLLIWSGTGDKYGFRFVSAADTDTVKIELAAITTDDFSIEADLNPPQVPKPWPGLSRELSEMNQKLLAKGDSIRNAYISSWITRDEATRFAISAGYNDPVVPDLIIESHGNFTEIMAFLENNAAKGSLAVELLKQISAKDLRDTRADILSDHLSNASEFQKSFVGIEIAVFNEFVLNPRVANEMLTSWRSSLIERFSSIYAEKGHSVQELAVTLVNEIAGMFEISENENHYGTPITPGGALKLNTLDSWSRRILTVALFRSFGIASRLEPGTNRPQYYNKGIWSSVWFLDEDKISDEQASATLIYDGAAPEPEYYIHFTLARYQNGRYNTLNYDYNKKLSTFDSRLDLLPGSYLMVKGNRIDDKMILASLDFFTLVPGQLAVLDVSPRRAGFKAESFGVIPADLISRLVSLAGADGDKGLIVIWLNPRSEPAVHLLNDIMSLKSELEGWGGHVLLLVKDDEAIRSLAEIHNRIPGNTTIAPDSGWTLLEDVNTSIGQSSMPDPPYAILVSSDGEVLYKSAGYRIGTINQILTRIR